MANGPMLTSTGSMLGNGIALSGIGSGAAVWRDAGRARGRSQVIAVLLSPHYGGRVQHFGQLGRRDTIVPCCATKGCRLAFVAAHPHSWGRCSDVRSRPMTQTSNRFFDEVARLMNDAAGVAQGIKREVDTMFKTQAEKWLRDLDLVKREEFEAVKDMARLAREENEVLRTRIAALETKLGAGPSASPTPPPPGDPMPPTA